MASRHDPICVSVINMKGGVGKTTIAALLGRYASIRLSLNVVMIDLDPQANLSQAFMGERYRKFLRDKEPSVVEIFKGIRPPAPSASSPTRLKIKDVLVKGTRLGGSNLRLVPSRFDFSDTLMDAIRVDPNVLAHLVSKEFQGKDLVLIDCAPTESILTRVAYQASRYVLVPVRPEYFATIGFPLLNDSLESFKNANRGNALDVAGVVINNSSYHYSGNQGGPERARSIEEIEEESENNRWRIFENQIPFLRGFPKIMRGDFGHPGDSVYFDDFAQEFFHRLGIGGKK